MTLDDLKAQRDALKAAIYSGAQEIRHGGKSIRYATPGEMRAALQRLTDEIAAAEGQPRRVRRRLAYTCGKGL